MTATALLLDMDGVLVDRSAAVERHWALWVERRGLDRATVLAHAHGTPTRDVVARFVVAAEIAAETDWVEDLSAGAGADALPGAWECLTQRHVPVAVVTSATGRGARAKLASAGLPVPDVLVTADDVARGKPDPACYRLALERLGADPAAAVGVEDSPAGIAALRGAGVTALALPTTFPPADLTAAHALLPDLTALSIGPAGVTW